MYENILVKFSNHLNKSCLLFKKSMMGKIGILVQLCTQKIIFQQKVICQKSFYAICNLFLRSHLISVCSGKKASTYIWPCVLCLILFRYIFILLRTRTFVNSNCFMVHFEYQLYSLAKLFFVSFMSKIYYENWPLFEKGTLFWDSFFFAYMLNARANESPFQSFRF